MKIKGYIKRIDVNLNTTEVYSMDGTVTAIPAGPPNVDIGLLFTGDNLTELLDMLTIEKIMGKVGEIEINIATDNIPKNCKVVQDTGICPKGFKKRKKTLCKDCEWLSKKCKSKWRLIRL